MDKTYEKEFFESLLKGQIIKEAESLVQLVGYRFRVISQDGNFLTVTRDYREDRVNVNIKDGVVDSIQGLG